MRENQLSRYGAVAKAYPQTIGKTFFVVDSTLVYKAATTNSPAVFLATAVEDEFPPDGDGDVRVFSGTDHLPIQAAIDACVNKRGDSIYILGDFTATSNILVNKEGIHIYGMNPGGTYTGRGTSITNNQPDASLFYISKTKLIIQDLCLIVGGTTTTSGSGLPCCINSSAVLSQCVFKNLNMYKSAGNNGEGYGMRFTSGVPVGSQFENIKVWNASGKVFACGMLPGGTKNYFKNLVIGGTSGQGIYAPSSAQEIFEDIILMPGCATGTEITGATSCIINTRNFANAEGVSTAKQANVLVDGEHTEGGD